MTDQQTEPAPGRPKVRLDTDRLTPKDLKRARVVLDGRNPFELLDDPIDRVVLLIWCTRSRQDPSFTWEQAEETPFAELEAVEEVPPTPGPETSGSEPGMNGSAGSKSKRRVAASVPDSLSSTG